MALSNLTKVQTLGIGSNIEVVGVITTGQFKSGTSNLHSTGVELSNLNVSGIATIGGNLSIGGTLTYQDVTNIDSVGIITARSNIDCNGDLDVDGHTELDNVNISGVTTFNSNVHLLDNDYARFGSSQDLSIFHDGTHNWFWSGGGHPTIHESSGSWTLRSVANQNYIIATENNSVDLYYSGNKKFETTNTGAVVTGILTATSFSGDGSNLTGITGTTINNNADNRVITGSGTANTLEAESTLTYDGTNLDLGDGKYVRLGASNDFQMWHNGGTGNTNIKQVTGDMYFYTGSDLNMHIKDGTSVDLYYANSKRLETTADGIKLYPDASGILIESGGDTNWTTGAMNIVRLGSNQADIRLGSNYGVKIGVSGNNDANEFQFLQTNTNDAFIRNEASNKIEFQTGGSTARFRIDNNGNCTINDGNLVIGTAGHGIDFSVTSDATHTSVTSGAQPSTDSEVLSDYEHGTWTPRLRAYDHTGNAGWNTMKYTDGTEVTGTGRYVRIGNHVWAGFKFESGSKVFDSNWTYWSIDSTPYGANHYDKASGSCYVSQTNFFTDSNSHIGGFVHGNESYLVVNKPNGHSNAQINTSNNNRYCYGHISIYTSRT